MSVRKKKYIIMTAEVALKRSIKIWKELADSGSATKKSVKSIKVDRYAGNCPLCEYVKSVEPDSNRWVPDKTCNSICPVAWPLNANSLSSCQWGGLWHKWYVTKPHEIMYRKRIAKNIVTLMEEALCQLESKT